MKQTIPISSYGEDIPLQILRILSYAKQLKFDEKPNYSYMRKLIRSLYIEKQFNFDNKFDWTILKEEKYNRTKI